MGKTDKQIIIILDGKCRYRISVQNILKTQNRGNSHCWDGGESGVGWTGDACSCQRALQDVMFQENTNEKGKEGKHQ